MNHEKNKNPRIQKLISIAHVQKLLQYIGCGEGGLTINIHKNRCL
jgi:hypothetical protein